MPAIYTHYITYDLLLDKKSPYHQVSLLGAQGSDPLFFYGKALVKRKNGFECRAMAEKFHHKEIVNSILAMIEFANRREKENERNALFAYINGYLFHYCVDRSCHPYIFYRTGFSNNKNENDDMFTFVHNSFESELDIALLKRYRYPKVNPASLLISKYKYLKLISEMYYFVSQKVYYPCNYFTRKTFLKSVKDMRIVYSFTYSRFKSKKNFYEKHYKYKRINGITHPFSIDESIDHLNLKHSIWRDPVTGVSNDYSVIDMIENAKRDYETTKSFTQVKDKKVLSNAVLRFVKDIDFDGETIGSVKQYYSMYRKDINL